MVEHKRRK